MARSSLAMAPSDGPKAERQKQISREMETFAQVAEKLVTIWNDHVKHITPILSDDPATTALRGTDREQLCPLASAIQDKTDILVALAKEIQETTGRVEI
jgi:hypothetical protein